MWAQGSGRPPNMIPQPCAVLCTEMAPPAAAQPSNQRPGMIVGLPTIRNADYASGGGCRAAAPARHGRARRGAEDYLQQMADA